MAISYSPQYSKTSGMTPEMLKPNEYTGRARIAYFDFYYPGYGLGAGDALYLCRLPKGARILSGNLTFGAMGAGTTIKVGINVDDDRYLGVTSVASAGQASLANTNDLFYGEELAADIDIFATAGGANYAVSQPIRGHFAYVID